MNLINIYILFLKNKIIFCSPWVWTQSMDTCNAGSLPLESCPQFIALSLWLYLTLNFLFYALEIFDIKRDHMPQKCKMRKIFLQDEFHEIKN
jgi:hypothetical protein